MTAEKAKTLAEEAVSRWEMISETHLDPDAYDALVEEIVATFTDALGA